nr:unnamed protein product [Spirometra erinaceieuropaei]
MMHVNAPVCSISDCIQVHKSTAVNVLANAKNEVELSCVVKRSCENLSTTLYSTERELCRGYGQATCRVEKLDDGSVDYRTTLRKPETGRYSFAFCQTTGDFLEYIIDWEG